MKQNPLEELFISSLISMGEKKTSGPVARKLHDDRQSDEETKIGDSMKFCELRIRITALIVVKDRKFNAHRMLLAAASPYFDAVLRYNKIVKEKIVVNCENPAIFEVLLNYIYSGSVVIDRSIVTELLKLANNLLIVRLKNHCVEYLERYIDVANCLHIRNLANRYNLCELAKRSADFFDSNINGCMLENVDLLDFNTQQLNELLNNPKYSDVIRPDVHLNFIVRWVCHRLAERESLFKELLHRCPFQQVSTLRLERMLDYNPFFAHSEISLYVILQEMHNVGMSMQKYEVQYRNLVKKYCPDKAPPTSASEYYASAAMPGAPPILLRPADVEDANDAEIMHFTRNASTGPSGYGGSMDDNFMGTSGGQGFFQRPLLPTVSEESSLSASSAPVYLESQPASDSLEHQNPIVDRPGEKPTNAAISARPALKLRISLAGIGSSELSAPNDAGQPHPPVKKRLLYGLNHYRKKQKLMLRRRGRPPKIRPIRFADGSSAQSGGAVGAEESESCFFDFANENVHLLDVFDEEDKIDPTLTAVAEVDVEATDFAKPFAIHEDDVQIQCEYCAFCGRTENQMRNHFAQTHTKNILYVCNVCQFECRWNRQFYDHMRQHFPGPIHQCDSCVYSAERIHVLLSHRLTHTSEKPFKCTDCEFRCRNRSNLVTHYRLHSGERPFECPECRKRFAVRATFEQHVAAHSDERPFVCDECDFATKYQSHLISHRRIHSGDLFRCEVNGCDYSSPKKSQLAAHLRTHLAVRSHKCRVCNRSFIEKSHLIRHERIHLADKPFKCNHCDYASSRRDKLKEHILKHHSTTGVNAVTGAPPSSSSSSTVAAAAALAAANRRRYRHVHQINQIAAKTRLNPPHPSNFFRPIPVSEALRDQQQQQRQQQQQQQQHQFLSQRRQRSGSESALPVNIGPNDLLNRQPLAGEIQIASANMLMSGAGDPLMSQLQQQPPAGPDYQAIMAAQQQQHQLLGNNERFQQQFGESLQQQGQSTRPSSVPENGEPSALSPSRFSLCDFQLHHNHSGQHHSSDSGGVFNLNAAPTPDTDLSTPGPHIVDSIRNSDLFSMGGERDDGDPGAVASFGGSHHLSIDESHFQAAVAAAASAAQQQGQQDADEIVPRPNSLPNSYGGVMQQYQMSQQMAPDQQQHLIQQPPEYFNLMGLNASQLIMQAQQQNGGQLSQQQQQHPSWLPQ